MRFMHGVVSVAVFGVACTSPHSVPWSSVTPAATAGGPAALRTITFTVDEGTDLKVDISPDGKLLTFALLGQVFVLSIQGGSARQLTPGSTFTWQPGFSADGRFIVFRDDDDQQLYRVPVAGGSVERAGSADTAGGRKPPVRSPSKPILTPDGRYGVEFPKHRGGDCVPPYFEIVEQATGQRRRLARDPECGSGVMELYGHLVFTLDGQGVITSWGGKLRRVDLARATTAVIPFTAAVTLSIRPLVRFRHRVVEDSLVVARRIEQPRLSPDGRQVVFGAFNRLWRMALPQGTPQRLTTLEVAESEPVWSPDGRYIAFATWTERTWRDSGKREGAIYRVRADGTGAPERLTRDGGQYSQLAYTADGQHLVANRLTEEGLENLSKGQRDSTAVHVVRLATDGSGASVWAHASPLADDCRDRRGLHDLREQGVTFVRRPSLGMGDTPDTLLRLRISGDLTETDRMTVCVFPAPNGDRVLVQHFHNLYSKGLYLLAIPPRTGATPTITLALEAPEVRRVTAFPPGSAEFLHWAPDGRSFTYSFGRTLYHYDVARADSLVADSLARAGTARRVTGPAYQPTVTTIAVAMPRDRPRGTLVFRHARLLTMRGTTVLERGDLVVRDRRIVALGPSGTVTIPPGAHVIEATGLTLMPGLVDLHNHVGGVPFFRSDPSFASSRSRSRRVRFREYESNLAHGVLTSRDPQTGALDFLTLEDLVASGQLLGPRIRNTGPGIGAVLTWPIRSLADARTVVRLYADVFRVEYLKEYNSRPQVDEWLAIAAAERGLNVVAHGGDGNNLPHRNAVNGFGGHDHITSWPLYDDVRQLLARTGLTLGHNSPGFAWTLPRGYFEPQLDPAALARVRRWGRPSVGMGTERAAYADHWRRDTTVAQLAAAGAHVAVGSHGELPGYGTHLALWVLVEGGMPILDALRSGTLHGAEALGLDQDLGSLEVGKLADLLVLDQNPLEKIQHTMNIRWVLFNGRLYDATTLNEQWPRPQTRAP